VYFITICKKRKGKIPEQEGAEMHPSGSGELRWDSEELYKG
jgi:hypothetical protein